MRHRLFGSASKSPDKEDKKSGLLSESPTPSMRREGIKRSKDKASITKAKPAAPRFNFSLKNFLLKLLITSIFGPASILFDGAKKACFVSSRPIDWAIKKVNPNYVNDVKTSKKKITTSIKRKAGASILTLSSFIAK